jgi:hypothetical protein
MSAPLILLKTSRKKIFSFLFPKRKRRSTTSRKSHHSCGNTSPFWLSLRFFSFGGIHLVERLVSQIVNFNAMIHVQWREKEVSPRKLYSLEYPLCIMRKLLSCSSLSWETTGLPNDSVLRVLNPINPLQETYPDFMISCFGRLWWITLLQVSYLFSSGYTLSLWLSLRFNFRLSIQTSFTVATNMLLLEDCEGLMFLVNPWRLMQTVHESPSKSSTSREGQIDSLPETFTY